MTYNVFGGTLNITQLFGGSITVTESGHGCTGTPRICNHYVVANIKLLCGYVLFHEVTFREIRRRKDARFLYSP